MRFPRGRCRLSSAGTIHPESLVYLDHAPSAHVVHAQARVRVRQSNVVYPSLRQTLDYCLTFAETLLSSGFYGAFLAIACLPVLKWVDTRIETSIIRSVGSPQTARLPVKSHWIQ